MPTRKELLSRPIQHIEIKQLDAAALEAVQLYRFKPATRNGQPVATKIAVQLSFHPASR